MTNQAQGIEEIYELSSLQKVAYIKSMRFAHARLDTVGNRIIEYLHPYNDISIVTLAGVSGVGKTTLMQDLVPTLLKKIDYGHPGGILFLSAPASVAKKMEISAVYDLATRILDPIKDGKCLPKVSEDRVIVVSKRKMTVNDRKDEMVDLLRARRILALALDEAFHLLRYGNTHALLDTLKSIASDECPKIVLIGGMEMIDEMKGYAQVECRNSGVYLPRYGATSGLPIDKKSAKKYMDNEKKDLHKLVIKIEKKWPYPDAPHLSNNLDYFMNDCLGTMRLIKRQCEQFAVLQGANDGVWDDGYYDDCRMPVGKISRIREEFEDFEERIRGFDEGGMSLRLEEDLKSGRKSSKNGAARSGA